MNYSETKEYLSRYIKAKIPIITINTIEKNRALRILGEISHESGINFQLFQMSQGITDLVTNTLISEERTVMSALDYIANDIKFKENSYFVLCGLSDIEDSTVVSRYLLDLAELAEKKSSVLIIITGGFVWNQLQRIGIGIELIYPDALELETAIKDIVRPYKSQIDVAWDDNDYKIAASSLQGLSEMEVKNIISSLIVKGALTKDDLTELRYAKKNLFSEMAGLESIDIDDNFEIAGLDNLKEWLFEKKNLMDPNMKEELQKRGINPPRGILLTGVPGCGKSLCSKATASIFQIPLYRLDLATVQGQYVGQSERQLKEALDAAEYVAPCVLWIDEIEKGLKESNSGVTSKMIGQFLFWLQECKKEVFVIASANSVDSLPAELIRKGRFDEIFFVDLPNVKERRELFTLYGRKYLRVNLGSELLQRLVSISEGFASADIEATMRSIAYKTISNPNYKLSEKMIEEELSHVVSLSKTNPEKIRAIREWGKDRAVSASKN